MSKRASLPITILSLGFLCAAIHAAGCGSDSSSGTGGAGGSGSSGGSATGGAAGGAGGKGGSAGGVAGGASGGAAGGTGGGSTGGAAGGSTGGAAGGSTGGAGGTGTGGAGGAGGSSVIAALKAMCTTADFGASGTGMYSTADFCAFYESVCGATSTHISNCTASYNAAMSLSSGDQRHCRSYHLCNAANTATELHCQHTIGLMNVCS